MDKDFISKKPGQLILTISNNGLPIVPEALNKLNTYRVETDLMQDKHIGILNIKRRLHFLYGEAATLEIDSAEITRFTIRIPNIHENK